MQKTFSKDVKHKKAQRFARKTKKANTRNRDCRLQADNPRDKNKQNHKDAVRARRCLLDRILDRDVMADIEPEPPRRLICSQPASLIDLVELESPYGDEDYYDPEEIKYGYLLTGANAH